MTLRRIEGYDYLPASPTATQLVTIMGALGYYQGPLENFSSTFPPSVSTDTAFGYGQSLAMTGVNGVSPGHSWAIGTQMGEVFFGYRLKIGPGGGLNLYLIDSVNFSAQIAFQFAPLGVIKIFRNDNGAFTLIGFSQSWSYLEDVWFYFEGHVLFNNGAGVAEARVNTVTKVSLVSQNTIGSHNSTPASNHAWADGIGAVIFAPGLGEFALLDDIYVGDNAGTVNNSWLGNVRIKTQLPSAAGASTTFSVFGAASNWQGAGNLAVDDTKYVYSSTVGDYDLYAGQPIINAPVIFGVQLKGAYRQDDATQRFAQNMLQSGGTLAGGTPVATNSTYGFNYDMWELDPNTGLGWTSTNANAIQFGPKVEA